MNNLLHQIASSLKIRKEQVENTLKLLEEGNTVPFIARYRKEMTSGLDEEQIQFIHNEYEYLVNLNKRKEDVLRLIEEQDKLTPEIIQAIKNANKLSIVEDIYRPYQQKRKTRASEAKRKGLEELANYILSFPKNNDLDNLALKFINEEVLNKEEAIKGAKDIIAEIVADNTNLKWFIKDDILRYGKIVTKLKKNAEDENLIFKMYYEYEERIQTLQPHRIMAYERGESLKIISVSLEYDTNKYYKKAINDLIKHYKTDLRELIEDAVMDGMKRLLLPSVEREIRSELKENASNKSIDIFSLNVEKLIMQPPLKDKVILGFDPAFRTGCKLAIINKTGSVLKIKTIYPHKPVDKVIESTKIMLDLIKEYHVDIIAIGNGTASRESELFVSKLINDNNLKVSYTIVSEAGASVYSASELARKEFPDLKVEERSAISIARRIQDPMSELIKIDTKSIGVGQYQHDLPKKQLEEKLDFAILKSVNRVGADLNTASDTLLSHISGLTKTTAKKIIQYREKHGKFKSRNDLSLIKGIGDKAIQQSAGFLRIVDGDEVLDKTSIHPESYQIVHDLLLLLNNKVIGSEELKNELSNISIKDLSEKLNVDTYTLEDIIESLKQPLRDYRDNYDGPLLRKDIMTLEDLKVNDKLEGVVRNVVDFGVFVDIGLKNDGLIHISKLAKTRVKHPSDILSIGDIVEVYIFDIDFERKKVQLSLFEN